ncbi:homeobox protein Rhox13-like [Cavia porcellus]|uniref:homeobox protein Rhox13-like n=1 Tax=Cavia porcellus TaxID=10141 RepID=UPI002FE21F84
MAAMEEEYQDGVIRSLSPEYWKMEVEVDPAPEVPAAAEGAACSAGAADFAADDPLKGHLDEDEDDDDEDGHILTQKVHVSQGSDTKHDMDQDEAEPDQLQPAAQRLADAGGRKRGRPRRRRKQFSFTDGQVEVLETVFQDTQYPDGLRRMELASVLSVPESRVKVWFNNRRAKYRKAARDALLGSSPPDSQDHAVTEEE